MFKSNLKFRNLKINTVFTNTVLFNQLSNKGFKAYFYSTIEKIEYSEIFTILRFKMICSPYNKNHLVLYRSPDRA